MPKKAQSHQRIPSHILEQKRLNEGMNKFIEDLSQSKPEAVALLKVISNEQALFTLEEADIASHYSPVQRKERVIVPTKRE